MSGRGRGRGRSQGRGRGRSVISTESSSNAAKVRFLTEQLPNINLYDSSDSEGEIATLLRPLSSADDSIDSMIDNVNQPPMLDGESDDDETQIPPPEIFKLITDNDIDNDQAAYQLQSVYPGLNNINPEEYYDLERFRGLQHSPLFIP